MDYSYSCIVGNVGSDPRLSNVGEHKVCNFNVAVNKTKSNGEKVTVWYGVGAWNNLADICHSNLAKGRRVMVIGEMQNPNKWKDQAGEAQASNQMMANQVIFLDAPPQNGGSGRPPREEDVPF